MTLTSPNGEGGGFFGRRVAISGDTAVVSAYTEDSGALDSGNVYIYRRTTGNNWDSANVMQLTSPNPEPAGWFGLSIAMSGDYTVAGAYTEDAGPIDSGRIYFFH
jgi:hypothetical protein